MPSEAEPSRNPVESHNAVESSAAHSVRVKTEPEWQTNTDHVTVREPDTTTHLGSSPDAMMEPAFPSDVDEQGHQSKDVTPSCNERNQTDMKPSVSDLRHRSRKESARSQSSADLSDVAEYTAQYMGTVPAEDFATQLASLQKTSFMVVNEDDIVRDFNDVNEQWVQKEEEHQGSVQEEENESSRQSEPSLTRDDVDDVDDVTIQKCTMNKINSNVDTNLKRGQSVITNDGAGELSEIKREPVDGETSFVTGKKLKSKKERDKRLKVEAHSFSCQN